jgi:galactokinase
MPRMPSLLLPALSICLSVSVSVSVPPPQRLSQLQSMQSKFDPLIYRRALHCVTEDIRTLAAVDALKNSNFTTVGELMTQSHRSLQHDYEVSQHLSLCLW